MKRFFAFLLSAFILLYPAFAEEAPPSAEEAPPPVEEEAPSSGEEAPPPVEEEAPPSAEEAPPLVEEDLPPSGEEAPPPVEEDLPPSVEETPPLVEEEFPPSGEEVPSPVEDDVSGGGSSGGDIGNDLPLEDSSLDSFFFGSDPLPVIVVEDEFPFPSVRSSRAASDSLIDDEPPSNPLFYGAVYVTGQDSRLGTVTVYFPANYRSGVLGLDSSGYLVSVYSGSVSGYLSGVNNNRVTLSTWSRPTYSQYSGGSSSTYTLNLQPVSSNADLVASSLPKYSVQEILPYCSIFLLGVLLICCMKRL